MTDLDTVLTTELDLAVQIHRQKGMFCPTLAAYLGGNLVARVVMPPPTDPDVALLVASVSGALWNVLKPDLVVVLNEAWMKQYDADKAPADMAHGHLQQMAQAGDHTVHTVLMAIAVKADGVQESLHADADRGYERLARSEYQTGGRMKELLRAAADFRDVPPLMDEEAMWSHMTESGMTAMRNEG